jgi:hypothetical protein
MPTGTRKVPSDFTLPSCKPLQIGFRVQDDRLWKRRWIVSSEGLTPRGNALTESAELTAPDGVPWIAYIEGLPAEPQHGLLRRTVMPGRRLRFDSRTESRLSLHLPAGSPFLRQGRLMELLRASRPLVEPEAPPVEATWMEVWQQGAARWRARLARHLDDMRHAVAEAIETMLHGHRVRF